MSRTRAPVIALLLTCACLAHGADVVLGPARDVGLIDDLGARSEAAWQVRHGANVTTSARFGHTLPGVSTTLLCASSSRKDPSDREPSHNWFTLTRTAPMPSGLPADFDGFRVVLGSGGQTQWWISVSVTAADGRVYTRLLTDSIFPAGRMVEHLLPLETFKSGESALTSSAARTAKSIEFAFGVTGSDLYLDKITVYRRSRSTGWLTFTTSHPAHNLFEPGEDVEMRFTPGGDPPSGAAGFEWEARRLDGKIEMKGKGRLDGERTVSLPIQNRRHGYYEVSAWWTDTRGKRLRTDSCIRAEGTVPEGIGTFAILPATVAENAAMFRRLGRSAYFGLHGDFMGLADRIGLAWRLGYEKWPWLEPSRPDRSDGPAAWARQRLAEPPQPPHALHILPFRGNMAEEVPAWARAPEGRTPPYADWNDYLAMVRDAVRVEKHRYPTMSPRLYGCAWEANLNMPPYVAAPPPYTPAQLVELFRRTREAVRAEDPTGLVLGPCPSVLDTAWFETMFEAGVLDHIDGIETHGYSEGAYDPEENDYPEKIARLNELMEKHKGRRLDIYCTELGQPGILGAEVVHRSQAERMVRTAIILKGEGVRVMMPFYGADYDRLGYWGFLFNLEVDAPQGPWFTKRVSPKPLVTAMAACVRMLEGTRPVRRIRDLGADVWGYVFEDSGRRITCLWTPGNPRTVSLAVRAGRAEAADIEGHPVAVVTRRGLLRIPIGSAPVYVIEQ